MLQQQFVGTSRYETGAANSDDFAGSGMSVLCRTL